jgi:predicted enzyme related to lactoylglutathione lyase
MLTWLGVPGTPEAWDAAAFEVDHGIVRIGDVALEVGASELAWGFDELDGDPGPLGVPTQQSETVIGAPPVHPNGVDGIDHVVYGVPVLDQAIAHIESVLGLDLRRRARPRGPDGPEMAFFRAGQAVIEVVEGPARPALWGVALRCRDLDGCVAAVRDAGGPIGDPKPAVQGGRIATIPKGHLGLPVAVMEPRRSTT